MGQSVDVAKALRHECTESDNGKQRHDGDDSKPVPEPEGAQVLGVAIHEAYCVFVDVDQVSSEKGGLTTCADTAQAISYNRLGL